MRRRAVPLLPLLAIVFAVAIALALGWGALPRPLLLPVATAPPPAGIDAADAAVAPATATVDDAAAASSRAVDEARGAGFADLAAAAARTGYRGRVVARSGAPVPSMTVRLFRGAPDVVLLPGLDPFARAPAAPELEAARATTGQDGRFELDGVAPRGLCWIRLEWPDLARAPAALRAGHGTMVPVQRTPAPSETVDLGDLRLKPGAVLTGRVVDGDGAPIAGALVRCANMPPLLFAVPIERFTPQSAIVVTLAGRAGVIELPHWIAAVYDALPIAHTVSAADGSWTLYGVDPGSAALAVTGAGHASLLRQGIAVAPDAQQHLGDLELGDGATATVFVGTAAGEPIAGAEVLVAPESLALPAHLAERAGTTDRDGLTSLPGLPRGRALAAARRSPQHAWSIGGAGPTDGRLVVVLPAQCRLVLLVVDQDGKPARDVRLQLVRGEADAGVLELAMFGAARGIDLSRRLQTLDDGRLAIGDLDRGQWRLLVGARDCALQAVQLELQGDTERTVQLRPAQPLRVRVLDAQGAPVAGAAIYTQARGGERLQRIVEVPLQQGTTDGDGCCTVRDLPTAQTRITASHPLHGQVHAVVQGTPLELELRFLGAGAIHGTLTDGGRVPAPGRWLAVLERRFEPQTVRGAVPDLPQLTLPGLDGTFAFAALQPGSYRVTVQDSATDVGTIGGLFEYTSRRKKVYPWNKADVEVHAAEQIDVRIDAMLDATPYAGPGAAVRGRVTVDGAPGAGALVVGTSHPGERRVTSRVDGGGAFDLGHCPAGAMRVVVVPREVAESRLLEYLFSHSFARDITIVDGAPLDLAIDIVTGSVSGEVRDWRGAPVADCRIVLFDRGGEGHSSALRIARTDGGGAFAFAQLPAGNYELTAQLDDFGKGSAHAVAVAAGAVVGPLAIALQAVARVQGRVAVDGLPRARRLLVLQPAGGGEVVRGGCAEDGAFDLRGVPLGRYQVVASAGNEPPLALGELVVTDRTMSGVLLSPR